MIVARTVIAGLASCLGLLSRPAAASDLCSTLDAFIKSVAQNEIRTVSFHTSWGSGFKDDDDPSTSMAAKRCDHGGYGPAKPLCAFLMENGATEFAGNNAKDVISCLSSATRFAPGATLDGIAMSFSYGTASRGSNVEVTFSDDKAIGGMVLKIEADGY